MGRFDAPLLAVGVKLSSNTGKKVMVMLDDIRLEICIDSLSSALAAQDGGACRVELCDNLLVGGTTPSYGMIKQVRQVLTIGLHVLIRPRRGDFYYTTDELAIMREDIRIAKGLGADGVVLGVLQPDGNVDMRIAEQLIGLARPMSVTWHRAFDLTRDPVRALEDIIALGCDYLLTSGQQPTAWEGRELLARLVEQAAGRIVIMPGGGVHEENIGRLRRITGAREFHSSGRHTIPSGMEWQRPNLYMGAWQQSEYELAVVDRRRVAAMLRAASFLERNN